MYGIGVPELLVITLIVALLFGAPILTFFMGYVVGKKRAATTVPDPATAPVPAPTPDLVPATDDPPATPKEPADE